jgi:hypothetical protein
VNSPLVYAHTHTPHGQLEEGGQVQRQLRKVNSPYRKPLDLRPWRAGLSVGMGGSILICVRMGAHGWGRGGTDGRVQQEGTNIVGGQAIVGSLQREVIGFWKGTREAAGAC